jgi:hypothetical protein
MSAAVRELPGGGKPGEEGLEEWVVAEGGELRGLLEKGTIGEAEGEGAFEGAEGAGLVAGNGVGAGLLEMRKGRVGAEGGGELEAGDSEPRLVVVESDLADLSGGGIGLAVGAASGDGKMRGGGLVEADIQLAGVSEELAEEVWALLRGPEEREEVGGEVAGEVFLEGESFLAALARLGELGAAFEASKTVGGGRGVGEAGEVADEVDIVFVGGFQVSGFELAGGFEAVGVGLGDERVVAWHTPALHGLEIHPSESFAADDARGPGVGAGEGDEAVGHIPLLELGAKLHDFGVVEVELAGTGEVGQRFLGPPGDWRRQAAAEGDDAGGAVAAKREKSDKAGSAGEAGDVDAGIVNSEAGVSVSPENVGGLLEVFGGAVAGVVGAGNDVPELLGGGLEEFDGKAAAGGGVEGVDDGPAAVGRVAGGKVEGVGVGGLFGGDDAVVERAGTEGGGGS